MLPLLPRFHTLGFPGGLLPMGPRNTIADVAGVTVGHRTRIEGADIRTGVTIVDPGVDQLFQRKIPAAIAVGNGYGKMAGISQVQELGTMETPVALTSTLAVGPVVRGVVDLVVANGGVGPTDSINAVVGEVNDGLLNALHADTVVPGDVRAADADRSADFALGCVGGGTGSRCFAWKGGVGTASRLVHTEGRTFTVGMLLQTNFGGALAICGVPFGRDFAPTDHDPFLPPGPDGSCMAILATDAPLSARQLGRVARRAFLGLARTGAILAHGSGDYAVAFTTDRSRLDGSDEPGPGLADNALNPFFLAAVETTEYAVYDALFAATDMDGRDGNQLRALPRERAVAHLRKRLSL